MKIHAMSPFERMMSNMIKSKINSLGELVNPLTNIAAMRTLFYVNMLNKIFMHFYRACLWEIHRCYKKIFINVFSSNVLSFRYYAYQEENK